MLTCLSCSTVPNVSTISSSCILHEVLSKGVKPVLLHQHHISVPFMTKNNKKITLMTFGQMTAFPTQVQRLTLPRLGSLENRWLHNRSSWENEATLAQLEQTKMSTGHCPDQSPERIITISSVQQLPVFRACHEPDLEPIYYSSGISTSSS